MMEKKFFTFKQTITKLYIIEKTITKLYIILELFVFITYNIYLNLLYPILNIDVIGNDNGKKIFHIEKTITKLYIILELFVFIAYSIYYKRFLHIVQN